MKTATKPTVKLLDEDGNAFMIIGACQKVARKAGWTQEYWHKVVTEMRSGDYDHLLQVAMKYFDVE